MSHEQPKLVSRQQQFGTLVFEGRVKMACPIERAALRDARLGWAARGLFAFLWDLPEGWRPCLAHLANMGKDGVYSTRSALAELEAVGAIRIEKLRRSAGQLAGQRWVVISATQWASEAPLKQTDAPVRAPQGGTADAPQCNFPTMEFPDSRETRVSRDHKLRVPKYKVPHTEGSPKTTTTTPRAGGASDVVVPEEDQSRIVWPEGLTEDQSASVRRVLLGNDWPGLSDAQAVLDELAGQLPHGKVKNPPGLLRRLLQRQREGTFTEEHGPEVRSVREARRKQAKREAAALAGKGQEQKAAAGPVAGASQVALRERKRLADIRKTIPNVNRGAQA